MSPPDVVLRYGDHEAHIADLRLPTSEQSSWLDATYGAPLVLLLHGGFWRAAYDRTHVGPLATALAAEGFAVCVPEFRRIGQPGGGWTGTFDDVAAAVNFLPGLAAAAATGVINPHQVLLAGHSAGGHLALWAAVRHRLPTATSWHSAESSCAGVVALAAVTDLTACYQQGLGGGAAGELIGGSPADHPERYALADPSSLLPAGISVRLLHGSADDRVPCSMSSDYVARSRAAGDDATEHLLPGMGHFEVIDPISEAWPRIRAAFRSLLAVPPGQADSHPRQP